MKVAMTKERDARNRMNAQKVKISFQINSIKTPIEILLINFIVSLPRFGTDLRIAGRALGPIPSSPFFICIDPPFTSWMYPGPRSKFFENPLRDLSAEVTWPSALFTEFVQPLVSAPYPHY